MPWVPDSNQLAQIFSHVTAPAFVLGAVAGFVSILIGRMDVIVGRIRSLNEIADDDATRAQLKPDIPRLKRRAQLLTDATRLALGSGICTSLLIVAAFVAAFFRFRHEYGVGVLFVIAVGMLGSALYKFAQEVKIGLSEPDHYR